MNDKIFDISFKVKSNSRNKHHYVRRFTDTQLLDCTCERWVFNRTQCEHMKTAEDIFSDPRMVVTAYILGDLKIF